MPQLKWEFSGVPYIHATPSPKIYSKSQFLASRTSSLSDLARMAAKNRGFGQKLPVLSSFMFTYTPQTRKTSVSNRDFLACPL